MKEILEERFHSGNLLPSHARWWKLVLTGALMLVLGIAAILLPARVVMIRILEVVFRLAKPPSGSMTAIAAVLVLVSLVAIDGLLHLFHAGVMEDKRGSRIRGVVGIVVAVAVIFWPGRTAYVAVDLIGAWAVLIGIFELVFVTSHEKRAKGRTASIVASLASIAIGVCIITWVFMGAVLVSLFVGVAAAIRGIVFIVAGIQERSGEVKANDTHRVGRVAA
jgi:uncharacterized membrane protein HdeD (DUF308 family)